MKAQKVYEKYVRHNCDSEKTSQSNAVTANAFVRGKYSVTNDGKKLNARMWETTSGKQLVQTGKNE